jgi:ATP-dependent Zn protease
MSDACSTAVHEAGHAVIATMLDHDIGPLTIIPSPELAEAGSAIIRDPYSTMGRWEERGKYRDLRAPSRARAIILMAGAEAETLFFDHCAGGDGPDREDAWRAIAEVDPGNWTDADYQRVEARLRRWATVLVRRHREKIERLADALLARQVLQPEEAAEIIGR